jgi:hypothetical protein
MYEEVEDARYSSGGYFQFRHEFRHLERRLRSDETVCSPNRKKRVASYRALRRLLIFISNLFLFSAAYMKVASSDRRGIQFNLSYLSNDNDAHLYLDELCVCSTYAIGHCIYSIKSVLFYSKSICLLLRQITLLV